MDAAEDCALPARRAAAPESRKARRPTEEGKGGASRRGDHGARMPTTQKCAITKTTERMIRIDHGRRRGLRSPRPPSSGTRIKKSPKTSGPRMITHLSDHIGINDRRAKYHMKYQSGRGEAEMIVGSGGIPSSGGPTTSASTNIVRTTMTPKNTSRQAA